MSCKRYNNILLTTEVEYGGSNPSSLTMMTSIDLAYPEKSAILYEKRKYPDGQQDIIVNTNIPSGKLSLVTIKSRFNSFVDLELILCTTKALRRLGVERVALWLPYLLGARSDRHFQDGGTSYLVDIIAPLLNLHNYSAIYVKDIHSDVAAACITNLGSIDNTNVVRDGMDHFKLKYFKLTSPDAGAHKKIYETARNIGYTGRIVQCEKVRNMKTGEIGQTVVPLAKEEYEPLVIVDDICDGGRTFVEIAKNVRAQGYQNDMYLIVTHGIFSKGFEELGKYFKGIHCSNSIKDIEHSLVTQSNVF